MSINNSFDNPKSNMYAIEWKLIIFPGKIDAVNTFFEYIFIAKSHLTFFNY